jgi:hypothetical protein
MKNKSKYLDFIKEKGFPLSEINPGSDEIALTVEDALQALEFIKDSKLIVLGGDVLTQENNKLIYAYQLWGQEYHVLNWYLTTEDFEKGDFLKSYELAKESISISNKIADKLKKKCYIVFVIE